VLPATGTVARFALTEYFFAHEKFVRPLSALSFLNIW